MIKNAIALAFKYHEGQYRKYGDNIPYVQHVLRVAFKVATTGGNEVDICAAILHDTKEDTSITDEDILSIGSQGDEVLALVNELTNRSKGVKASRRERKKMDRDHIKSISLRAKKIKLIDRIDNLNDMKKAPEDFKKLYIQESKDLLNEALTGVDEGLEKEYTNTLCSM